MPEMSPLASTSPVLLKNFHGELAGKIFAARRQLERVAVAGNDVHAPVTFVFQRERAVHFHAERFAVERIQRRRLGMHVGGDDLRRALPPPRWRTSSSPACRSPRTSGCAPVRDKCRRRLDMLMSSKKMPHSVGEIGWAGCAASTVIFAGWALIEMADPRTAAAK